MRKKLKKSPELFPSTHLSAVMIGAALLLFLIGASAFFGASGAGSRGKH